MNPFINERLRQRMEDAVQKQKVEQHKKKKITRAMLTYSVLLTALQFLFSQFIVWGLSLFHVDSGVWGVFLIMEGAGSMIAGAVALGMMRAVHDTRS